MVVPGRELFVADRPVDRNAIAGIGLEIHRAPAIALTTPGDGASSHLITAYPVEALLLDIGIVQLVHEPMFGRLGVHITRSRRDGLMVKILARGTVAVRQLPGIQQGG